MKRIISNFSWKNWNKKTNAVLTAFAGIVGTIAVWNEEILSVIHEAPFPISTEIDLWVKWILKISSLTLTIVTLGTKKKNDIDIGVNISSEPKKEPKQNEED
jgi:uncharacterized membrane protein